ncbi:CPBP family intramembrane glutamic endopeptidase [Paenibacillus sp. FSL E2-0201]|uniref:CPBP family intramembrane glutamic endopeptidase n=1 Tax=Paenibacillus sp. FSL E2-0201 TaxID=2954726 RepID=UPI0030D8A07E
MSNKGAPKRVFGGNYMTLSKALKFLILNCILIVIIYSLQYVFNFLTYDINGPMTWMMSHSERLANNTDFISAFSWYLVQFLITCLLIHYFLRKGIKEVGFSTLNLQLSMKYIKYFILIFPFVVVICCALIYSTLGLQPLIEQYEGRNVIYAVKDIMIFGTLPGLSEEPFFRIFVIQFFLLFWFKRFNSLSPNGINMMVFLSSFYFMLGHIFINWSPFYLKYDVIQLITAFILGIYYTVTYLKTKSILASIVCHSYSDFIIYLMGYLLYFYNR